MEKSQVSVSPVGCDDGLYGCRQWQPTGPSSSSGRDRNRCLPPLRSQPCRQDQRGNGSRLENARSWRPMLKASKNALVNNRCKPCAQTNCPQGHWQSSDVKMSSQQYSEKIPLALCNELTKTAPAQGFSPCGNTVLNRNTSRRASLQTAFFIRLLPLDGSLRAAVFDQFTPVSPQ